MNDRYPSGVFCHVNKMGILRHFVRVFFTLLRITSSIRWGDPYLLGK